MEITRRSDYAIRILRAAYRANGDYLSITDISEEENIPYAFARNIQHALLHAGFVKTRRGARGGLALNVDPSTITLYEVLQAIGANMFLASCSEDTESCEKSDECTFNKVWLTADKLLESFFSMLTLEDVLTGDLDGDFADEACNRALASLCPGCASTSSSCDTVRSVAKA